MNLYPENHWNGQNLTKKNSDSSHSQAKLSSECIQLSQCGIPT